MKQYCYSDELKVIMVKLVTAPEEGGPGGDVEGGGPPSVEGHGSNCDAMSCA